MKIFFANGFYVAIGHINERMYFATGDSPHVCINKMIDSYLEYVKSIFANPTMSAIGNLPPGYVEN